MHCKNIKTENNETIEGQQLNNKNRKLYVLTSIYERVNDICF